MPLILLPAFLLFFHPQEPDLGRTARFWQNTLNLGDWNVTLEVVRAHQLESETVGEIDVDAAARRARIRVLDPADSDLPAKLARADQHLTVVHELVHLRRLANGEKDWRDEATTVAQTVTLVRGLNRRPEIAAIER